MSGPNDSSPNGDYLERGVGKDTTLKVQLGFAIFLITGLIGFHTWLDDRLDRLDRGVERIEERAGDRWPYTYMQLWVSDLKAHNPGMKVPPLPDRVPAPRRTE